MIYRLAPFCSWRIRGGTVVLETPDQRLHLALGAAPLLADLAADGVAATDEVLELARHNAVVAQPRAQTRLLMDLHGYFKSLGLDVIARRRGPALIRGASLPRYGYVMEAGDSGLISFGQDSNRTLALLKAAVELYERLSCDARYNVHLITPRFPSWYDREVMDFLPWQRAQPDFPFADRPSGIWARYADADGADVSVPFEMTCYPHRLSVPVCADASSNGVAAHPDHDSALIASLFEVIERDALMVHWFKGRSRERIKPPAALEARVRRLDAAGMTVDLVNLTLSLAPVVLAIVRRADASKAGLCMGLSADADPAIAADRALREAEFAATRIGADDPDPPRSQREVATVTDHHLWYNEPANRGEVLALIGGDETRVEDIEPGAADISGLTERLRQMRLPWLRCDLNPDGAAATGISVVRSVVPGLAPVTFGFGLEPLGLARLHEGATVPIRSTEEGYRVQPFA